MKTSKLNAPYVKQEIAKRLASGETQSSIAREIGVCHTTVSRFSRKEDVQRLIEKETLNLLEAVPDAVQNMKTLVREMNSIPREEHKNRELSYRASQKILESAGILNTPVASQTVVNIIRKEEHYISPLIQTLLTRHLEGHMQDNSLEETKEKQDE